jgi:hypothetical protein
MTWLTAYDIDRVLRVFLSRIRMLALNYRTDRHLPALEAIAELAKPECRPDQEVLLRTGCPIALGFVIAAEAAGLGRRLSLSGRSATLPGCCGRKAEATGFHICSGSPSARRSAAMLSAEVRVSGWLSPSIRRRRARVSWSRARARWYSPSAR